MNLEQVCSLNSEQSRLLQLSLHLSCVCFITFLDSCKANLDLDNFKNDWRNSVGKLRQKEKKETKEAKETKETKEMKEKNEKNVYF